MKRYSIQVVEPSFETGRRKRLFKVYEVSEWRDPVSMSAFGSVPRLQLIRRVELSLKSTRDPSMSLKCFMDLVDDLYLSHNGEKVRVEYQGRWVYPPFHKQRRKKPKTQPAIPYMWRSTCDRLHSPF